MKLDFFFSMDCALERNKHQATRHGHGHHRYIKFSHLFAEIALHVDVLHIQFTLFVALGTLVVFG